MPANGAFGRHIVRQCDELGEALNPERISDLFITTAKAAGVPRIRLHDGRPPALCLMQNAGVPMQTGLHLGLHKLTYSCPAKQRDGASWRLAPSPVPAGCLPSARLLTCDNSAAGGTRTPDPLVRSQVLYPLSYSRILLIRSQMPVR